MELEPFSTICDHQDTKYDSHEIENEQISKNINSYKYIKGYMGQQYLHCAIFQEHIMVVLYTCRYLAIFLLCFGHQDTESKSQ